MKLRMGAIPAEAYQEDLHVRSYEIGREGSMRPSTLLRYLEHIATNASAAVNFEPDWYARAGTAWVVRTMDLFIGQLPRYGDHLNIATWVAEYRHVQAIRDYAIWNADSGALVARASARWAYIDRVRAVPVRLPEAMTTGMQTYGHIMTTRSLATSPHTVEGLKTTFEHTAHEYEVDSQQHINNCAYADWLWEAAHQTIGDANPPSASAFQPRYYTIEYIRPTQPGERIQIATHARPSASYRLQLEQEMLHASTGNVCVRASTIYLGPRTSSIER